MSKETDLARVLVVGDSETTQVMAASALRRAGYQIRFAHDSADLAQSVLAEPVDLVLLVALKQPHGAPSHCAALRRCSEVPLLLMTEADDGILVDALESGADDCLLPPFRIDRLLAQIEALLRRASWSAMAPQERPRHRRNQMLGSLPDLARQTGISTGP